MEETMTLSQAADLIIVMTFGVTVITVFFGTVTEKRLVLAGLRVLCGKGMPPPVVAVMSQWAMEHKGVAGNIMMIEHWFWYFLFLILYLARLAKFFQHCFKLNSRPKALFIFFRFRFIFRHYIFEFIGGFNSAFQLAQM